MKHRRTITLCLTAVLLLGITTTALAVLLPGAMAGQFGITPARRHVVGRPPLTLEPTTVINSTDSTYQVKVFPALLTQSLSGAFEFAETPRNLNDSKIVLSASPERFTLGPGERRQVSLDWNVLPAGRKWLAIGVVFQGVARHQHGPVHIISRLLSVNFLRIPGLNLIRGRFTRLSPEQFAPRVLRFLARVKNTGNRFWAPAAGRFVIRNSAGQIVDSQAWPGDVVLPGAQRDFPIDVKKVLPAGSYTATVGMRFGARRKRTTSFRLVGPNELPTPVIAVRDFNATGVIGSPAHLTGTVLSTGTAPASVVLHLYLGAAGSQPGSPALASTQVRYANLAPGSRAELSRSLGASLKKGSYRAILSWTDATGSPHTLDADFTATQGKSFLQRVWDWIKRHLALLLGLLTLLLLALLALLLWRARRRQRENEAQLAAARAQIESAGIPTVRSEGPDPAPRQRAERFEIRFSPRLRPLLRALGMSPRRTGVLLTSDALRVRAGAFSVVIPLDDIASVGDVSAPRWAVAGVHTDFRGRWIVNGAPGRLLRLNLARPARASFGGTTVTVERLDLGLTDNDALADRLTADSWVTT